MIVEHQYLRTAIVVGGAMIGMDPDDVQALANRMKAVADSLQHHANVLGLGIRAVHWTGPAANRFRSIWTKSVSVEMRRVVTELQTHRSQLIQQINEQRRASSPSPIPSLAPPHAASPSDGTTRMWGDKKIPRPSLPPRAENAPEFNSSKWWTKGEDFAFAKWLRIVSANPDAHLGALLTLIPSIRQFTMPGVISSALVPNAWKMLGHYLGASGKAFRVDPDAIMHDIPPFTHTVRSVVEYELSAAVAMAEQGHYGTYTFVAGWSQYTPAPKETPIPSVLDWYLALGTFSYTVTGVVSIEPPSAPDNGPVVNIKYQVHIADQYDFTEHQNPGIHPWHNASNKLRDLHSAGFAREYRVHGTSEIHRVTTTER